MTTTIVLLIVLVLMRLLKTALTTPIPMSDPMAELYDLLGMTDPPPSNIVCRRPPTNDRAAAQDINVDVTIDHYPVPLSRHLR